MKKDLEKLKLDIMKTGHSEKELWEIILRIVYADMLGHKTDFAQSFIVNCIQHNAYKVKRIAYLACIILLDEESPFRIMMVAAL